MELQKYISENWPKTVRIPCAKDDRARFKLKKPYTTPCIGELFINFFYWDTYFANLGLMLDGYGKQAENNLENMKFFIDFLGYMPNADHLIMRTQPPMFTRGVYDYFRFSNDLKIVEKYADAIIKELNYFESDRMTPCGLNAYGHEETRQGQLWYYDEFDRRIGYTAEEKKLDKFELVGHMLAIAESGWDFNPRFQVKGNRFAARDFAHLDLNCLLYDAEKKAAEMFAKIGRAEDSTRLEKKAANRAAKINERMLDKFTGIYYDYNFKTDELSKVLSAASFYPYAVGISDNKAAAKVVLNRLDLPYGISACEYRGESETYFQWDYPNLWPTNAYFAYEGLKSIGLQTEAASVRDKYLALVKKVFEDTGALWEKYDALNGAVSVTSEYETPKMMGWTAGIFRYFEEERNAEKLNCKTTA